MEKMDKMGKMKQGDQTNGQSRTSREEADLSHPKSRESTTFPPLGPGYYSTKLNVPEESARIETFRVGYIKLLNRHSDTK